MKKNIKFIDLFSGIGAFHISIKDIFKDSQCIAAVDNNKHAEITYKYNFFKNLENQPFFLNNIESEEVIEKLTNKNIKYNFLCAGFPCQPFSKTGSQTGIKHKEGKLFVKIIEIIKKYNENHLNNEIKIIFLENVAYLAKHNNSDTWTTMKKSLKDLGYSFFDEKDKDIILNPLNIGIPQNRQRLFLIAFHDSYKTSSENFKKLLNDSSLDLVKLKHTKSFEGNALEYIDKVNLDLNERHLNKISDLDQKILDIWQEFCNLTKIKFKTLGFPIWLDFFEIETKIPNSEINSFSKWKYEFYVKNKKFYFDHKENIDLWWYKNKNIIKAKKIYQKFEWNIGGSGLDIKECIVQFRHSGIRIKKPNFFPALVKTNCKPIIWDKKINDYRFISIKEALLLQSFDYNTFLFPEKFSENEPFQRIGNSINVEVIKKIINKYKPLIEKII